MGLAARAVTFALALRAAGCSSGETGEDRSVSPPSGASASSICDGSTGLRFAYKLQAKVSDVQPGYQVLVENGAPFLYVNGQCEYFALANPQADLLAWEDVRHGVLSELQARQLAEETGYARWAAMAGLWPKLPGTYDGALELLFSATEAMGCPQPCVLPSGAAPLPAERQQVDGAMRAAERWAGVLYASGVAMDGPMRGQLAHRATVPPGLSPQPWPLSMPIDPLVTDASMTAPAFGTGSLFDAPSDIEALRALRRRWRAGDFGDRWALFIPIAAPAGNGVVELYVRDAIPLEGAQGLVTVPPMSTR